MESWGMNEFGGHCQEEEKKLQLLDELQRIFATALDSLGGQKTPSKESAYLGWAVMSVNRAAEGFHVLRSKGRVAASKLLVRLPLEIVFYTTAVLNQPGIFYRKAFTEWKRETKLFARSE